MEKIIKYVILFVTIVAFQNFVLAQSSSKSKIGGIITDGSTGESLIGANVIIIGTSLGAATNIDGEYTIANLPAGEYTLKATYLGYEDKTITVNTLSGRKLEVNIKLTFSGSLEMGDVTITAQAKGQLSAINEQLTSKSIKNVVAADRIREVPDANAAESVGRLPGVSLQRSGGEGSKVVIRGLSPKYSIVEVEGVRLAGADGANDRSVGLNVVSNEMLGGIELSKSLTPDKDADAIGGVVNLKLREAEKGFHFDIRALGAYNDLEKDWGNYYLSGGISNRFLDNKLGVLLNLSSEQMNRSSDIFRGGYAIAGELTDFYTISASITERKQIRKRYGGSLLLDYKIGDFKVKLNNFYSQMNNPAISRDNIIDFTQGNRTFYNVDSDPENWIRSHSAHMTYMLAGTELNLNLSYSKSKLDNAINLYPFSEDDGNYTVGFAERKFAEPSHLIEQYVDFDSLGDSGLWEFRKEWNEINDENQSYDLNWKVPFNLFGEISGNIKIGGKYTKKDRKSDNRNVYLPFSGGWGAPTQERLKEMFGLLSNTDIGSNNTNTFPAVNYIDPDYDFGEILNGRYTLGWAADIDKLNLHNNTYYERYPGDYFLDGFRTFMNNYNNIEERSAGYIMFDINYKNKLTIIPGVRYEKMHTDYSAYHLQQTGFNQTGIVLGSDSLVNVQRENEHWFPSVNMKYQFSDNIDIRAAFYKSTTRPSYIELSPSVVYTETESEFRANNPYLKPALADNYDLGVSVYSNEIGLFTVNGFYKEINDLVFYMVGYNPEFRDEVLEADEEFINSIPGMEYFNPDRVKNGDQVSIPVNNLEKTFYRGIEISWQTNLWYLPGLLSGLVLDINYSRIWSSTYYPYIKVTDGEPVGFPPTIPRIFSLSKRKGRMIDQPDELLNVRLGWDYKGFSARLSFRYQGQTMVGIDPKLNLRDKYTGDLHRFDLSLKQKITDNLSLHADIANINEHIDDSYHITQGHQLPTASEFYGLTSQFGLRYEY
ncbi:MAG: TonB-dependent receptor [Bacteroidota bacterium]